MLESMDMGAVWGDDHFGSQRWVESFRKVLKIHINIPIVPIKLGIKRSLCHIKVIQIRRHDLMGFTTRII